MRARSRYPWPHGGLAGEFPDRNLPGIPRLCASPIGNTILQINPVLSVSTVAAAYNAGPGRVVRWMEMYGDPRTGATDWVDWVERIPFSETRNYLQRGVEALIVYRARMGGGSTDLYRELTR